jgi:hypothetical protein
VRHRLSRGITFIAVVMLALTSLVARGSAEGAFPSHRAGVANSLLPAGPTARCCMGMAYDAARGEIVLFGGEIRSRQWVFHDTWTWDGSIWTRRAPTSSPPPRFSFGMAYHATTERAVVVDGRDEGTDYRDTWAWDGTTWHRERVPSPSLRLDFGMASDELAKEIVLFGGWTHPPTGDVYYHDTWTWNGRRWTRRNLARSPAGRHGLAMAFDALRGEMVLFGGIGREGTYFGDTWIWDGSEWTRRSPQSAPSPRTSAAIACDPDRGRIVLFGGFGADGRILNDTWLWDGTTWEEVHPPVSPTPRYRAGLVFDATRGETVLFGGSAPDGEHAFGDTWSWDGSTWTLEQGYVPG